MQVRYGTWQGIPAVYKVWDLGDSLEPLLEMQAELDAYQTLCPLQASVSASLLHQCMSMLPLLIMHQVFLDTDSQGYTDASGFVHSTSAHIEFRMLSCKVSQHHK